MPHRALEDEPGIRAQGQLRRRVDGRVIRIEKVVANIVPVVVDVHAPDFFRWTSNLPECGNAVARARLPRSENEVGEQVHAVRVRVSDDVHGFRTVNVKNVTARTGNWTDVFQDQLLRGTASLIAYCVRKHEISDQIGVRVGGSIPWGRAVAIKCRQGGADAGDDGVRATGGVSPDSNTV